MFRPDLDRDPDRKRAVLTDREVAQILGVTIEWVRAHAGEIPGFHRLGQYYRFRSSILEGWLGALDRLLLAAEVAELLRVPESWVYANADQIPGAR